MAVWILALAVAVGSTSTAHSQTTGTLPEGTYSGGIYLGASTSLDVDEIGNIDTRIDTAGVATLTNVSESISGDWTLEGTGVIDGTATYRGVTTEASGSTVITGSGAFSGTPSTGRLSGTSTTTGQWTTAKSAGDALTVPIDATGPLDEPLTDLLNACSQLLGKWDSALPAKFEGPGLTVTGLAAYLVLSDTLVITAESAIAERIRDLAKRGNSILGEARGGGDGLVAIAEGAELLRGVEKLQADIANEESDCPAVKGFTNILTQIAQDALDATLKGFEKDPTLSPSAETLRKMIRLGSGTGATGSGAKDTDRATDLEGRMKAQANEAFNDTVIKAIDTMNDESPAGEAVRNELVDLVALGEQQGWDLKTPAGVSAADMLAVLGI